jgi:hypothetical protein
LQVNIEVPSKEQDQGAGNMMPGNIVMNLNNKTLMQGSGRKSEKRKMKVPPRSLLSALCSVLCLLHPDPTNQ